MDVDVLDELEKKRTHERETYSDLFRKFVPTSVGGGSGCKVVGDKNEKETK